MQIRLEDGVTTPILTGRIVLEDCVGVHVGKHGWWSGVGGGGRRERAKKGGEATLESCKAWLAVEALIMTLKMIRCGDLEEGEPPVAARESLVRL